MSKTTGFFRMFVGNDASIVVAVTNAAGNVVDISSATVVTWKMAVNENTTALISKSLGSGIAITDGGNGKFTVTLDAADTTSLAAGTYFQEGKVTLASLLSHVVIGTIWLRPTLA